MDLGYGCDLIHNIKDTVHERNDKLIFIKIKCKTSAICKIILREWEDKPHSGRKYLQKAHLINDCFWNIENTHKTQY